MKSLKDISWNVTEEEYRADPALSYSTLAKYEREGFNNLGKLFDKIETPSLTFGSAVDALITGGQEEFDERFAVLQFPSMSDNLKQIADTLFDRYHETTQSLDSINDEVLAQVGEECGFYANAKYKNYRIKLIREGCADYYRLRFSAVGKTILDTETYKDVCNTVNVLKESEATKMYFAPNNPFDNSIERFYQLKFKATVEGIDYRCMMDEVIVDHTNKFIYMIDLKTSSKPEWDFFKSFIDWNYMIQARLYARIFIHNLHKDEYYKDFTVMPYRFIVANKRTLTPLVWSFEDTFKMGTLYYGKDNRIECRDPYIIGKELHKYLETSPKVPTGIEINKENSLEEWLRTL